MGSRPAPPAPDPLARLAGPHPKAIDLSLARIARLLDRLGRPQDRLPPVVHVAGTNGKGSVVAILRACLEAADYRVHAYTSPHLVRFNERIVVAGREIGDGALAALIDEVEAANAGAPLTVFEAATAAAMLAFARAPADVALLETGLGGRLDATNVVRPAVAAITPIGLDHQAWLGDTISAIAAEKAAILKPGVPAVVAPQPEEAARAVIESFAARAGAPLVAWSARPAPGGFAFRSPRRSAVFPPPALFGAHQVVNAGTALACLDAPGMPFLSDAAIARGLAAARWPGRLQRLPCAGGREVWLDGGHNPSAGAALAAVAAGWRDRPLHLVVGMMRGKDPHGFLAPLAPRAAALTAVPVPGEANALPPSGIAAHAAALGVSADVAASVPEAIASATPRARVLVCGSLYLAGSVLGEIFGEAV